MRSLEERQADWDKQYDSPMSEPVKSRPARPSIEQDQFVDEAMEPTKNLTDYINKINNESKA